jgi:hypothetical protein
MAIAYRSQLMKIEFPGYLIWMGMETDRVLVEEDGHAMDGVLAVISIPDPSYSVSEVLYPCLISSEGVSLANFYFAPFILELEEDFNDRKHPSWISSPSPSPIPK